MEILENTDKEILENIDINKEILQNIDIDKEILGSINIDKEILQNIDIDKISNLAYRLQLRAHQGGEEG